MSDRGFDCGHRIVVDCNAITEKYLKHFPCPQCYPGTAWHIKLEPFDGKVLQFTKQERAIGNRRWYVWVLNQILPIFY